MDENATPTVDPGVVPDNNPAPSMDPPVMPAPADGGMGDAPAAEPAPVDGGMGVPAMDPPAAPVDGGMGDAPAAPAEGGEAPDAPAPM